VSTDENNEETAVAAYWATDGIDRYCVGFLPRHCVCQAATFDGHLVQVVAQLANSDSPAQRRHSRHNRGACYATIIDTKVTSCTLVEWAYTNVKHPCTCCLRSGRRRRWWRGCRVGWWWRRGGKNVGNKE
jgi:hypothetical protein